MEMSVSRFSIAAGVTLLATLVGNPDSDAMAQFLRVGDIQGQSGDADHEGWIPIETVTISPEGPSAARPVAAPATGPGTLTVTRSPDASSPALIEACSRGEPISEVALDVETGAGGTFIAYVLSDVVIGECDQTTSGPRRIESITFQYQRLDFRPVRPSTPPAPGQTDNPQR